MPDETGTQSSSLPTGGTRAGSSGFPMTPSVPPQNLTEDPLLRSLPRTKVGELSAPLLGKIPMLARLGRGAMGAVYYGIHPRLRIEVAVKVLQSFLAAEDPAMVERFYREAQTAARVRSQHLVHVSDVDEEFGLFYIVMEYVKGISVADYIKRATAAGKVGVPEGDALRIVIAASKGLAAAHAESIIHRDVKPSNIMLPLTKDGEDYALELAKLTDLGLARPENQDSGLTMSLEALGTPGYMAPEQAQDAATAGKPADVFSMGATLYALLRGRAPFSGATPMAVLQNTIQQPHPPISEFRPDVSLATASVLDRCLAKEPRRRYPDGAALVEALRACRDELGGSDGRGTGENVRIELLSEETTMLRRKRGRTVVQSRKPSLTKTLAKGRLTTIVEPDEPNEAKADSAPKLPKTKEAKKTQPALEAVQGTYPPLPAGGLGKHERYIHWPIDPYDARQRRRQTAAATGLPEQMTVPLPGGETTTLTLLPAGEYLMGSPQSEEFREKDEHPHYVRLTRPFYIGLTPVTQAQWQATTGENASRFKDLPDSPQRPVERVSWNDIHAKFLPQLAGVSGPGWQFRLPTEAEWEYACRAGAETPFCFGQAISMDKLNCKEERTSGNDWKWIYSHDLGGGPKERQQTTPVGVYPPNAWGLVDVHGNVWEWCEDWYNEAFYQNPQAVDPLCTVRSEDRVLRGGGWNYSARYCRAACRYHSAPDARNFSFGFRVVCAMTGSAQDETRA